MAEGTEMEPKTRLQVATNVDYDVFRKYLNWMVDKNLVSMVDSEDGHERVALTPKGQESYRTLVQWVNEVIRGKLPGI
jgi:predicted transcriptional regulator